MEEKKRWTVPAFGNREHSYHLHTTTTLCYGSGSQARKANGVRMEKHCSNEQEQRRHCKVFDAAMTGAPRSRRAPMAVDEDLYKIPPELFCQTPKRKRVLKKLLSGCMGLNCVC